MTIDDIFDALGYPKIKLFWSDGSIRCMNVGDCGNTAVVQNYSEWRDIIDGYCVECAKEFALAYDFIENELSYEGF